MLKVEVLRVFRIIFCLRYEKFAYGLPGSRTTERTPERQPFHPWALCWPQDRAAFMNPSASHRHLVSAHDHGRLRSNQLAVALLPSPHVGLAVR